MRDINIYSIIVTTSKNVILRYAEFDKLSQLPYNFHITKQRIFSSNKSHVDCFVFISEEL